MRDPDSGPGHAREAMAARVWRWFFPQRIDPSGCVLEVLRFVYPTVDWDRVSFHEGWPHVIGLSRNAAVTLPDPYTTRRIRVYFKAGRWNPGTRAGLGLIVHEGFHVLQCHDVLGGRGLGFARPFLVQYLACWAGNGFRYRTHPMEEAAYAFAGRAASPFEAAIGPGPSPCADPIAGGTSDGDVLEGLRSRGAHLVRISAGIDFLRDTARGAPGSTAVLDWARRMSEPSARAPAHPVVRSLRRLAAGLLLLPLVPWWTAWIGIWTLAALVLALVRIGIEGTGVFAASLLWLVAGVMRAPAWFRRRAA